MLPARVMTGYHDAAGDEPRLGGYPPFYDEDQDTLLRQVLAGEFEFTPEYWDCVSAEGNPTFQRHIMTVFA